MFGVLRNYISKTNKYTLLQGGELLVTVEVRDLRRKR